MSPGACAVRSETNNSTGCLGGRDRWCSTMRGGAFEHDAGWPDPIWMGDRIDVDGDPGLPS